MMVLRTHSRSDRDRSVHAKIARGWFHERRRRKHRRLNQLSGTQTAQRGAIQRI